MPGLPEAQGADIVWKDVDLGVVRGVAYMKAAWDQHLLANDRVVVEEEYVT